jgi:hypothetical protein
MVFFIYGPDLFTRNFWDSNGGPRRVGADSFSDLHGNQFGSRVLSRMAPAKEV